MGNRRKRDEFSKATKIKRWDHCGGRCEGCSSKLMPGRFHYDHDIEAALRGDNSFENCRVLCINCHDGKTKERRKDVDKARRVEEKHLGVKPKRKSRLSAPDGCVYDWNLGRYVRE